MAPEGQKTVVSQDKPACIKKIKENYNLFVRFKRDAENIYSYFNKWTKTERLHVKDT